MRVPAAPARSAWLRGLGTADLFEEVHVDLAGMAPVVSRVMLCASIHDGIFAWVDGLHVRLDGDCSLVVAAPALSVERAVILFEPYRRGAEWKVRAVGQGYQDGLAGLARDFGVRLD